MHNALRLTLILAGGLTLAATSPALAQQPSGQQHSGQTRNAQRPATTPPADPIADKLRTQGEAYHRAPDSAQTPEELRMTRALNDEIRAQNDLADNEDRANQAAHAHAMERHRQEVSRLETERANVEARTRAEEAAYRNSQAQYQQQMDAWRATVAACERGDRARCRAGQTAPQP